MEIGEIRLPKNVRVGEHPEVIINTARFCNITPEELVTKAIDSHVMDLSAIAGRFIILAVQMDVGSDRAFYEYPFKAYLSANRTISMAQKYDSCPHIVLPNILDSWPPRRRQPGIIAHYYPYTLTGKPMERMEKSVSSQLQKKLF